MKKLKYLASYFLGTLILAGGIAGLILCEKNNVSFFSPHFFFIFATASGPFLILATLTCWIATTTDPVAVRNVAKEIAESPSIFPGNLMFLIKVVLILTVIGTSISAFLL